jgi:hypothetical protein
MTKKIQEAIKLSGIRPITEKVWSANLKEIITEVPTNGFRWLKKKDGTTILQQCYEVGYINEYKIEWKDVRIEEEK